MQEGKEEQSRSGAYSGSRGQASGAVLSSAGPLLALHGGDATRRPATIFEAGTVAWRLIITANAGAVAGGRAAIAGRDTVGTKGGFALILVSTIAKAEHLLAVVHLRAAPGAATIFPKHPHIEGLSTIVLEVDGAPPAQAARAGKRLPATGQGCVARDRDLDRDP